MTSPTVAGAASSGVARSFRNLALGEALNKGARFASAAILARTLGAHDFGAFNVGVAVAGITTAATGLGLGEVAGREAAIEPSRSRWLAGRVLGARAATILPIVVTAVLVTAVAAPANVAVVAVVGLFACGTASSGDWLGRALQRTIGVGLAAGVGGVAALGAALAILATQGSYVAALLGFAAAEYVTSALCWRAVRHVGRPRPAVSGVRDLLRRSWPVAISSLVVYSYYANLDTIILSASHSASQAGIYSGAYRVFLLFNTVAIFAAYANFPALSRASTTTGDRAAGAVLHQSLMYLFAYGGLVVGLAEIAGGPLLGLLFGNGFRPAGPTFVLLCVGVSWYAVGYPLGYSLIARGQNRLFLAGAITAGVLSVGLDLLLIPPYGMIGAGAANAAAFAAASAVWTTAYERGDPALPVILAGLSLMSAVAVLGLAVGSTSSLCGALVAGGSASVPLIAKIRKRVTA